MHGGGKVDILWRTDLIQQTDIWTMNGTHVIAGALTDTYAPSGWVFG